jgi:hypothetical protein
MVQPEPSRQTLDQIPPRVLMFLIAVGTSVPIRAALASRGYTQKESDYAWDLLKKLAGTTSAGDSGPSIDKKVQDAIVELDRWDEPNFESIEATLQRFHPEQAQFVFEKLEAKQGPEAVVSVSTLLDRLDTLESGEDRKDTRKADTAALKTLGERGYTKDERKRLRDLVKLSQSVVLVAPVSDEERTKALTALYRWLSDWSASAKLVISRRDHLIRLGLAKRKKTAKTKKAAEAKAAAPPAPPVVAAAAPAAADAPPKG